MSKEFNPKQRAFIEHYVVTRNATQAAIAAGYSEKTATKQGSRLLTNEDIRKAVDEKLADAWKAIGVTQEMVTAELAKCAFSNIGNYVEWSGHAIRLKTSAEIKDEHIACIAEINETAQGGIKFKMHDKVKSLHLIGQDLGMFNDREPIVVKNITINMDEKTAARIDKALESAY